MSSPDASIVDLRSHHSVLLSSQFRSMSHASPLRGFASRPAEELHDGTLAGKGFVFISLVKTFRPMASCQLVAAGPAVKVLESVLLMPGTRA